jgi:hypothetical protein
VNDFGKLPSPLAAMSSNDRTLVTSTRTIGSSHNTDSPPAPAWNRNVLAFLARKE